MKRRVADEPLAERHARYLAIFAELDGQLDLELAGIVQQEDAEGPVVDDASGQLRDPREELIQIQHGRDLAADLGERFERLGVQSALLEQARVDERDGHVRGELPENRGVANGELIAIVAQEIQRAEGSALV